MSVLWAVALVVGCAVLIYGTNSLITRLVYRVLSRSADPIVRAQAPALAAVDQVGGVMFAALVAVVITALVVGVSEWVAYGATLVGAGVILRWAHRRERSIRRGDG